MRKFIFMIIFTILHMSFNLHSQNSEETDTILSDIMSGKNYGFEKDRLTSKINIFTSWKETYKYMRDCRFRFYKRFGRTLTLEFRYRSPYKIFVSNETPIIFSFENGSETELYNIQKVVYSPYLMGNTEYYDIEIKYKFNDDSEFDNFANDSITNIRFNFINYLNEESFDDILMSPSITSNWQNKFSDFREGIDKLIELEN